MKGTQCFRNFSISNDLFTKTFTAQMGRGKIQWGAENKTIQTESSRCGIPREALKNKAEKSNAPLGALITVYKKGLGAFYSSGSRPGMTSHQWAMARVNSFLKGGKARQVDSAQWERVKKHRNKG